jgi:periplasmic divalent cation tolerance protein
MVNNLKKKGVVFVTTASRDEAQSIAQALIEARLAACVTIFPVHSFYRWDGKVNSEDEWQLMIKTELDYFPQLSEKIKELHSYSVPEIIALAIAEGPPDYLNWLSQSLGAD